MRSEKCEVRCERCEAERSEVPRMRDAKCEVRSERLEVRMGRWEVEQPFQIRCFHALMGIVMINSAPAPGVFFILIFP